METKTSYGLMWRLKHLPFPYLWTDEEDKIETAYLYFLVYADLSITLFYRACFWGIIIDMLL